MSRRRKYGGRLLHRNPRCHVCRISPPSTFPVLNIQWLFRPSDLIVQNVGGNLRVPLQIRIHRTDCVRGRKSLQAGRPSPPPLHALVPASIALTGRPSHRGLLSQSLAVARRTHRPLCGYESALPVLLHMERDTASRPSPHTLQRILR